MLSLSKFIIDMHVLILLYLFRTLFPPTISHISPEPKFGFIDILIQKTLLIRVSLQNPNNLDKVSLHISH